jgi:DNA ligase-1
MLAGKVKDVNKLKYPVMASYKLDGVRAFVWDGKLMSRSFKPIPNVYVQNLFSDLPQGVDGELILGDPTAPDAYRKTVSAVMGSDNPYGANVTFHVFDVINDKPFGVRLASLVNVLDKPQIHLVDQIIISTPEQLLHMEEEALNAGHEGLMVRDQGLTKELRTQLWKDRDILVGKCIKYKHFPTGGKDRPRFPIWLGFRSPLDM